MKKKFLVSYWVSGCTEPTSLTVTMDGSVTDEELPHAIQDHLVKYETFRSSTYHITILNFWFVGYSD